MAQPVAQGEVWQVRLERLDDATAHEVAKSRPALVVSVDGFNNCGVEMVVVIPAGGRPARYPTDITITEPEGGLDKDSTFFCDQIRSISTKRLLHRRGAVSVETLRRVGDIVAKILLFPQ